MDLNPNDYMEIDIESNNDEPIFQVTVSVNDESQSGEDVEVWHGSVVFQILIGAASMVVLVSIGLLIWKMIVKHKERMKHDLERSRQEKFDRMLTVYNSIRTRESSCGDTASNLQNEKAQNVVVDSSESLSSLQPSICVQEWPSVNSCLSAIEVDTCFPAKDTDICLSVVARVTSLSEDNKGPCLRAKDSVNCKNEEGHITSAAIVLEGQDHLASRGMSVTSHTSSHGSKCLDHEHCIKFQGTQPKLSDFRERVSSFRAPVRNKPIRQAQTFPLSLDEIVPCPRNAVERRNDEKQAQSRGGSSSNIDLDCLVPATCDSPLAKGGIIKLNDNVFLCTPPCSGTQRPHGRAM